MMVSASLRKTITDLTRRRARTFFAIATLALAVASISFVAVPTLIDRSMQTEVRAERLPNVRVSMRPLPLSEARLAALAALPNVAAVEPRSAVDSRVFVGERRAPAELIGVRDFARQRADVVRVTSGSAPAAGEVLVDIQNANVGLFEGRIGGSVRVVAIDGAVSKLRISGVGRNLGGGRDVIDDNVIVLYTTAGTVAALSGESGYGQLAFRLRDTTPAAVGATLDAVRRELRTVRGFTGFGNLPELRAAGDWPGKEDTKQFGDIFAVITLLALLSALVLISNTMSTLVSEQTREIGIMRALGARRRQVALVYVKTALLLGALGALLGIAFGLALSNLLASYFGSTFLALDVGFGVDWTVLLLSGLVGLLGPPLAALPAIRRALRVDLRGALESSGSAIGGQDVGDRLLRRVRFLPRTVQIGLRSIGRRKRRSLATALIIGLAAGNLLAVMALAAAVTEGTRAEWSDHREDVRIWTGGRTLFGEQAAQTIRATAGVAEAQPALVNDVQVAGEEAFVWGVPREALFRYRLAGGRWFSAPEEQGREQVAVIEENLARSTGTQSGDRITLATAAGSARFRIVGVASNQQEDGTVLFVPLTTLRSLLGEPNGVSTYWVKTTSADHALVDRTTTQLEDRLSGLGYAVGSEITYVGEEEDIADNRTITTSIAVLGFLIVAISMVGLANAITMSVIERTREIGILRALGARARDVRRIFAAEAVMLALAGWLLGIPIGYALDRFLVWLVREVANVKIAAAFPAWNVALALIGTVALALLIALLPTRRATRLRPGDALRYA